MPIQFLCPNCNKQARAPDTYAGKLIRCKQCGQTMRIPTLEAVAEAASPDVAAAEDAPVESFPEAEENEGPIVNLNSAPAPVRSRAAAPQVLNIPGGSPGVDVDLGSDAPIVNVAGGPSKSKSGAMLAVQGPAIQTPVIPAPLEPAESPSGMPQIAVGGPAIGGQANATLGGPANIAAMKPGAPAPAKPGAAGPTKSPATYFNVNKGTVSCLLLGIILFGLGIYESSSVFTASDPPAKMSVKQLVAARSLSNRHVQIGGAYLWTGAKLIDPGEKGWARAWIPIVDPKDPGLNRGDKPKVLMVLKSRHVKTQADLDKWGKRTAFTGMVLDDGDLSTAERSKLMSAFNELRGGIVVLDEGEKPRSGIFMAIYFFCGVLMLAAGGFLMFLYPPIEGM